MHPKNSQYGCGTHEFNQMDGGWPNWAYMPNDQLYNSYIECVQTGQTVILTGRSLAGVRVWTLNTFPHGLVHINNANFQSNIKLIIGSGTATNNAQLFHLEGTGTHTITDTEFKWCGANVFKYNKENNKPENSWPDGWDPSLIVCDGSSSLTISSVFFNHPDGNVEKSVQAWELYPVRCVKISNSCSLTVRDSKFYNTSSHRGGSFFLFDTQKDCTITGCTFSICNDRSSRAHGILIDENSRGKSKITHCTFTNCGSGVGSLIYACCSTLVLEDSTITYDSYFISCRCVYCRDVGDYQFRRNTFSNVYSDIGYPDSSQYHWMATGIHIESKYNQNYRKDENIVLDDNTFDNIVGENQGRCIHAFIRDIRINSFGKNTIKNCPSGSFAIKIAYLQEVSSFTLHDWIFQNNVANDFHGGGGGIWVQNLVENEGASNKIIHPLYLILQNCQFSNNRAEKKGGGFQMGASGDSNDEYHLKVKLLIKGCTFDGNSAEDGGGAIAIQTNRELNIEYCSFRNNKSPNFGGAIFIQADVSVPSGETKMPSATIHHCTFYKNTGRQANSVYLKDATDTKYQFTECNFHINNDNSVPNSGLYSIFSNAKELYLESCTFTVNSDGNYAANSYSINVENNQGMIQMEKCIFQFQPNYKTPVLYSKTQNVIINECKFSNFEKFAVSLQINSASLGTFTFTNNDVTGNTLFLSTYNIGSDPVISGNVFHDFSFQGDFAIQFLHNTDTVLLENNTFENMRTITYAGAAIGLYFSRSNYAPFKLIFDNCKFRNNVNTKNDGNGGAFMCGSSFSKNVNIEINSCEFNGNNCQNGKGGALYFNINRPVMIYNCTFIDNTAKNTGAICIEPAGSDSANVIMKCKFHNCYSSNSFAVQIQAGKIEIEESDFLFDTCDAGHACRAINFGDISLKLENCHFKKTFGEGSIVFNQKESSTDPVSVTNCIFEDIKGANKRCFDIQCNTDSEFTFKGNVIRNMTPQNYFGSIKIPNKEEIILENLTFVDNECQSLYGGGTGLWIEAQKITFLLCNFTNNSALQSSEERQKPSSSAPYYNGDGGAFQYGYTSSLYNIHLKFENCTFSSNKACRHGGALAIQIYATIAIKYCVFIGNIANNKQTNDAELLVENHFHKKTEGRGGAIYFNPSFKLSDENPTSSMQSAHVEDCKFISNSAFDGFAIYIEGDYTETDFRFVRNEFINNFNAESYNDNSSIVSTEICPKPEHYLQFIENNYFHNEHDGKDIKVREILCVDHYGIPLLTKVFSDSEYFSVSTMFTNSNKFSFSDDFTSSKQFSNTGRFSESKYFSFSKQFTKSDMFEPTNGFSSSSFFSQSTMFTESDDFSSSKQFTKSNLFEPTGKFCSSSFFSKSSMFTESDDFSSSKQFTKSNFFSQTEEFSSSTFFSQSTIFTESAQFSPSFYSSEGDNKPVVPTTEEIEPSSFSNEVTTSASKDEEIDASTPDEKTKSPISSEKEVEISSPQFEPSNGIENKAGNKNSKFLIIGIVAAIVVLLIISIIIIIFVIRRKRNSKTEDQGIDGQSEEAGMVKQDISSTNEVGYINPLYKDNYINSNDPFDQAYEED